METNRKKEENWKNNYGKMKNIKKWKGKKNEL